VLAPRRRGRSIDNTATGRDNESDEENGGGARRQRTAGPGAVQSHRSMATVQTILDYQRMFPEVFEFLASGQSASMDMFHELDLFPSADGLERMSELVKWLEALPTNSALRQPYGTQTLEESIISELEEATSAKSGASKEVVISQHTPSQHTPDQASIMRG